MLGITEYLILIVSVSLIALVKIIDKNPPPILGIYQRQNGLYWLKVAFMYLGLSLRKIKSAKKQGKTIYSDIEKPMKLSLHEKAVDAVYLNGANKYGDYIVVGSARRKHRLVDGFVYLKINSSNLGVLESPKLPDTALYKTEDGDEFSAEGIKISPLEPMKKWKFTYEGKMKEHGDRNKLHDVKIDSVWISDLPYFNFDSDMDPLCMAKSLAYEKWTKAYFESLEASHQTHYEQFGVLQSTITIDKINYNINFDTLRDHSFGIYREFRQFKRYALHFFTTEDGNRFSIGKICMPINFSRLTLGYVYLAKDRKILPVQNCDLELYQHGELGTPPKDYAFSFMAGNNMYTVKIDVIDSPHFYMSKDWEAKMFERLCKFEVNGVGGWGVAQWQYRNIEGKNII